MSPVQLGRAGPRVSTVGLGCMAMSGVYGPADRRESLATIDAALEAGVTLLDSGDFYGMGHNELLLREALSGRRREQLVLSVKFGAMRTPGGGWSGLDCRPAAVKNFLAYSLQRLGVDYIDIYRPARLDPAVPIEETVGAVADMVKAGYVRYIGLSEVGVRTLRRATVVHPICDLQIEYSLLSRGIEREILPACRALGIGLTVYGVLGRGLISGHWRGAGLQQPARDEAGARDFRRMMPRFSAGNVERNLALVEAVRAVADGAGASVAQLAIAWVRAQGEDIVPLIGARTRTHLTEALGALALSPTKAQRQALEQVVPAGAAAGERYGAEQMAHLDSERDANEPSTCANSPSPSARR